MVLEVTSRANAHSCRAAPYPGLCIDLLALLGAGAEPAVHDWRWDSKNIPVEISGDHVLSMASPVPQDGGPGGTTARCECLLVMQALVRPPSMCFWLSVPLQWPRSLC